MLAVCTVYRISPFPCLSLLFTLYQLLLTWLIELDPATASIGARRSLVTDGLRFSRRFGVTSAGCYPYRSHLHKPTRKPIREAPAPPDYLASCH